MTDFSLLLEKGGKEMDQTATFEIKDGKRIYDVNVTFQLQPQGVARSACHRCKFLEDGFVRFIRRIEIIDPETTLEVKDEMLHKRIADRLWRKDFFQPICGDCLDRELDNQLQEHLLQQFEDGEFDN